MDTFFTFLRRSLTGIVTLVFAFVFVYVPQPHTPNAFSVKNAEAFLGTPATEQTQLFHTWMNTAHFQKESILDAIAFQLAKAMISQILQSTITWVNSGFEGSPAFVQDLDRFLLNVADEEAGRFLRGLDEYICEPFRVDIKLALAIEYQQARENKKDSCSLSDIVDNIEDFFDSNVSSENFWAQWVEVTSKPEVYTPYGQYLTAREELARRIEEEEDKEKYVLNLGSGFFSKEVCTTIEGPTGPDEECVYVTPGKTIADRINKVLGADVDQLVAADELNELISALLGQVATQALQGAAGLLGLSGGTGYTTGNYDSGSLVDELVNQSYNNGTYAGQGVAQINEKYEIQIRYNALANEYIPRLSAIANGARTSSELRARATQALSDAEDVRQKTTAHITFLRPIVAELDEITTAYQQQNLSTEEKRRLGERQAVLISSGIQYQAYIEAQYVFSQTEWSDIVR